MKKYKYSCKICGNYISQTSFYGKQHCKKCYLKTMKGKENPNYKHGKSSNNRCFDCGNKISACAKRCELCEDKHHSNLLKGKASKLKGRRYKIYYCKICHKKIFRETYKRTQMCRTCWNKFLNKHKELHGRFGKKLKPHWIRYKSVWMRSNWEMIYAKYLDKNHIKWQYEPKTFDLGKTTYTPDFYLPECNLWIEVKGYFSDVFKNKFSLFKIKFKKIKLEIIDKSKLMALRVINKRGDIIEGGI